MPDFDLNETRKYPAVSKANPNLGEPTIVDLKEVNDMFCFPQEDIAKLIKEWNRFNQHREDQLMSPTELPQLIWPEHTAL